MALGPYPEFSTSPSTANTFRECRRRYFWKVYGSWGGWDRNLPLSVPKRLAYTLKQGRGLKPLVGVLVHAVAKNVVLAAQKGLPQLPADQHRRDAISGLHEAVAAHRAHRWKVDPKGNPPLLELFYEEPGFDGKLEAAEGELVQAVEALLQNGHLERVRSGEAQVVVCESLERLNISLPGGVVILWLVPDLVYRIGDRFVVVDWKTGRPSDDVAVQVGLYAAWAWNYAVNRLPVGDPAMPDPEVPPQIATAVVYLRHFRETVVEGTAELQRAALQYLERAAAEQAELVEGGDLAVNRPKGIEAFPMLPDGAKPCGWCEYRRLCQRG